MICVQLTVKTFWVLKSKNFKELLFSTEPAQALNWDRHPIQPHLYFSCSSFQERYSWFWQNINAVSQINTLFGTALMQISNRPIHYTNYTNRVTVTQCIKACRYGQEIQLLFSPNNRMGKNCDVSDSEREMIVGARQGGLSISETAGIFTHISL